MVSCSFLFGCIFKLFQNQVPQNNNFRTKFKMIRSFSFVRRFNSLNANWLFKKVINTLQGS